MDCSPPGSFVHGISQARILEWVAISFFKGIFPTQGSNPSLLHCRWILYLWATREAQLIHYYYTAKSLQSCPTLCDPTDGSPPSSPVPGILQARTLEWAAISFSNAWKWKWSRSVVSDSWRPHGLQPTRLLCPWDFPGKSTRVGCHCLLQINTLQGSKYSVNDWKMSY